MKLDFNLQVKQRQGLALTAQVQQAIKLLHMTNMEIQEYVSDQFQDNPFVEANSHTDEMVSKDTVRQINKEVDQSFKDAPYIKQETENKITIENQFETGEGYIPRSTVSKAESSIDTVSLIKACDKSLYSHCVESVSYTHLRAHET